MVVVEGTGNHGTVWIVVDGETKLCEQSSQLFLRTTTTHPATLEASSCRETWVFILRCAEFKYCKNFTAKY